MQARKQLVALSLMLPLSLAVALLVPAQVGLPENRFNVRTEDSALLPIPGAVLYNNVFGKGDIANYRQSVFQGESSTGWDWNWPETSGAVVKSYPEVLTGRSPWSDAGGTAGAAGLGAGDQLPRR